MSTPLAALKGYLEVSCGVFDRQKPGAVLLQVTAHSFIGTKQVQDTHTR